MTRKNRKKQKRNEAITRQEIYTKLTIEQKIKKLDKKLGVDIGATKERNKLYKGKE